MCDVSCSVFLFLNACFTLLLCGFNENLSNKYYLGIQYYPTFIMMAAINAMGPCAHNPRGNLWFNDETTLGHKLLMKMGWSKGKGLGKNEDGIKENISLKFKNTNSGLGYKDDPYAGIMKTEYESILKNLNANYPQKDGDKLEDKSCEQRSKVVKGRPRYPKLFFGKDVNKYSEKDMKSIFICSFPSTDNKEVHEGSTNSQKQESQFEFPQEIKTSTLSISDYFAKKMKKKKINDLSEETASEPNEEQVFLDSKISKKRKRKPEINYTKEYVNNSIKQKTEIIGTEDNFIVPCGKKSSSKKRRKIEISTDETDSGNICNLETEIFVPKKKKPKLPENLISENNVSETSEISHFNSIPNKKKSKVWENKNSPAEILANEGAMSEISTDSKSSVNVYDIEIECVPSKKKQRHSENLICENNVSIVEISEPGETSSSKSILHKKRKKSKQNKSNSVEILANRDNIYEICTDRTDSGDICDLERECTNPNKKKKKLLENLTCRNSVSETSNIKSVSDKKRRKSKLCDNENSSGETFACDGRISCQIELSSDKALQLKEKRKKRDEKSSVSTDASENNSQLTIGHSSPKGAEVNNNVICSKKKKKKIRKLKSCLKSRTGSYSTKNVSFSEQVSYRVIDSDYDSFQNLSDQCSEVKNVLTNGENDSVDSHKSELGNSTLDTQVIRSDNFKGTPSSTDMEEMEKTDAEWKKSSSPESSGAEGQENILAPKAKGDLLLSSLPLPESTYYNSWVESQRQALKMKMYKNMLKSIKEHEVLKTSNLLSIKGYGNCGFK